MSAKRSKPCRATSASKCVAIAEMTIGRGRTDTGAARRLGEGKAGRPVFANEIERGIDQCLAQISVMIAPAAMGRPVPDSCVEA